MMPRTISASSKPISASAPTCLAQIAMYRSAPRTFPAAPSPATKSSDAAASRYHKTGR